MNNETVYSEWKDTYDANNRKTVYECGICKNSIAPVQHRYVTDRNGDRYEQFRVYCPFCDTSGKVYRNKGIAIQSWISREHLKPIEHILEPKRRRRSIP